MSNLKGTKTEANLWAAFAGESQARNKYTYYASKAKKEGFEQIAAFFTETADNEKEHAKLWFKLLHDNAVPDTMTNLKDAAEGENYEWTDMYDTFAKEVGRCENMEQMRQLMDYIVTTRKEGRISVQYGCEGFLGAYEGEVRDRFFACQAGVTVGSVLVDGSISACASIRADYHQGNIYTDDFWEVWNNRFESYRNREWMRKDACAECKFFRYCKGGAMHLRDEKGELLFCHLNKLLL